MDETDRFAWGGDLEIDGGGIDAKGEGEERAAAVLGGGEAHNLGGDVLAAVEPQADPIVDRLAGRGAGEELGPVVEAAGNRCRFEGADGRRGFGGTAPVTRECRPALGCAGRLAGAPRAAASVDVTGAHRGDRAFELVGEFLEQPDLAFGTGELAGDQVAQPVGDRVRTAEGRGSVPIAEFEEKSYEVAMAIELAIGHRLVASPGHVAEKILGYDSASSPSTANPIWGVLGVKRPVGLHLAPPHWAVGAQPTSTVVPSVPISLILQFKRPTYLRAPQSRQWMLWRRPYYRFSCTPHQHNTLVHLERSINTSALVRYAAPAFWRYGELEAASLRRTVATSSGYVSPLQLGRHRVWTYQTAGAAGKANPSGETLPFEHFDELQSTLPEMALNDATGQSVEVYRDSLLEHLHLIGTAAQYRRPRLRGLVDRWRQDLLEEQRDLSHSQVDGLCNLASIVTLTESIGATWFLLAL